MKTSLFGLLFGAVVGLELNHIPPMPDIDQIQTDEVLFLIFFTQKLNFKTFLENGEMAWIWFLKNYLDVQYVDSSSEIFLSISNYWEKSQISGLNTFI